VTSRTETAYSTRSYAIVVDGVLAESQTRPGYQLLNTETNVVEGESFSLPIAIGFLIQTQASLDEAQLAFKEGVVPPSFTTSPEVH
jgi:hypothetical protein